MRVLFTVMSLGLCLGSIAACGGSSAVNFYGGSVGSEANTAGGSALADGAAGSFANAGQATTVTGGSSFGGASVANGGADVAGASETNAGAGTAGVPSDAPCSPVIDGIGGMTGPFGTTGPYCLRVSSAIVGWGCSNFQGRTLKVNGTPVDCSELPLPEQLHGDYYFDVSGGGVTYASMYWY
jgi:hypothetical protein